jgi:hypothetical protein
MDFSNTVLIHLLKESLLLLGQIIKPTCKNAVVAILFFGLQCESNAATCAKKRVSIPAFTRIFRRRCPSLCMLKAAGRRANRSFSKKNSVSFSLRSDAVIENTMLLGLISRNQRVVLCLILLYSQYNARRNTSVGNNSNNENYDEPRSS